MTTAMTKVFRDIFILLRATRFGAEGRGSVTFYHFNDVLRNERRPERGRIRLIEGVTHVSRMNCHTDVSGKDLHYPSRAANCCDSSADCRVGERGVRRAGAGDLFH
jgi:hypothetical protein